MDNKVYRMPGVYLNNAANVNRTINSNSPFACAFMGVAQAGEVGVYAEVTSWSEYVQKFARGLATPFMATSYLAHAIYGFFQNGGSKAYVVRVAKNAVKASASIGGGKLEAKSEGVWGNSLKVSVTPNVATPANFDISILLGNTEVESYKNVATATEAVRYWVRIVSDSSNYVKAIPGALSETDEVTSFAGGTDGGAVTPADYAAVDGEGALTPECAIHVFDFLQTNEVVGLCVPGVTNADMFKAMVKYRDEYMSRVMFCIFDSEETDGQADALALAASIDSGYAGYPYPWQKIVNPLSSVGDFMLCPPSGHWAGVVARFFSDVGPWRAAAGTKAYINGSVDVARKFTEKELGDLNMAGVICITPQPNYGVVVWGARTMNKDPNDPILHVSDALLDLYVKQNIYYLTLPYVFELNVKNTWTQIQAVCESFLNTLYKDGALKGESADAAYFVVCDETTNTAETINANQIRVQVGYAGNRPAEFIIFDITHTIQATN